MTHIPSSSRSITVGNFMHHNVSHCMPNGKWRVRRSSFARDTETSTRVACVRSPSARIGCHGRFATLARTGTVREMEAADWASLSDQESTESLRLNGVRDFGQGAQEHVRQ
jgi:hypothetical protein